MEASGKPRQITWQEEAVHSVPGRPVEIRCKKHGIFYQAPLSHLVGSNCPRCATVVSKPHQYLIDFLGENNISVEVNDRNTISPLELDIYIPEHKLAVEIRGLYWHSKFKEDKDYHQGKTDACEALGIRLMQFWDYEVWNKTDIVKSMLLNSLHLLKNRIYARNCLIREISQEDYKAFLENNHIQGAVTSRIRLGLEHDERLVSVLGASVRAGKTTIDRFASIINTSVVGGFSRLFSWLPGDEIYTHSANRYATGNVCL